MQMCRCWRASEDGKNKLHLESEVEAVGSEAGGTAQESELFHKEESELLLNYKIGQALRAAYSRRAERKADKVEAHPVHSKNGCCAMRGGSSASASSRWDFIMGFQMPLWHRCQFIIPVCSTFHVNDLFFVNLRYSIHKASAQASQGLAAARTVKLGFGRTG